MKWSEMQKPLKNGFQAFRDVWDEDRYLEMTEGGRIQLFWETGESYFESEFVPSTDDISATDWRATGPGGE